MRRLLLIMALMPVVAWGQIRLEEEEVVKVRRNVEVRFTVRADRGTVRGPNRLVCTPCLIHGSDTAWLAPFEVFSRTSLRRERQDRLLDGGIRNWQPGARQMLQGGSLFYTATVPYERWMRTARLSIRSEVVGCARCRERVLRPVSEELSVYVAPRAVVGEIAADPRSYELVDLHRRWEFRNREMKIDFRVSEKSLDPSLGSNRATLEEIVAAVDTLLRRPDRRLSEIEIYGFASPEGAWQQNERLAEGRARALRDYVRGELPGVDSAQFRLVNGEENWEGLRRLVAASGIPGREDVLAVLDTIPDGAERKVRLKELHGGETYRLLLRTFYPRLRNACYVSVYYDVLEDRAAATINRSLELIRTGRYSEALELLDEVADDPRSWNAIGVCHMMLEEEDRAAEWFERALAAGIVEARSNLSQIR